MTLAEYLDGMRRATTADELEASFQAPHPHAYRGRIWAQICRVRIEAGRRICDADPNGRFVPAYGPRRSLIVCGQAYHVGHGQNSTGVRYAWHYAQEFAEGVLRENGFSKRAAHIIWSWAFKYPHRSLQSVQAALAGELPDPRFDRLLYRGRCRGPIRVDRETESGTRAHRPCACGGWRWDWGCAWTGYCDVITWRCDRCPRIYVEYLSPGRLYEIRNPKANPGQPRKESTR